MMVPEKLKNKKVLFLVATLLGASLLGAGVFASSAITINSGSVVSLGAGATQVQTPCGLATISAQQYLDSNSGVYHTGTFTIDLGNTNSGTCYGKTLSLAYATGSITGNATWAIKQQTSGTYTYGYATISGGTTQSSTLLQPFDTAATNLSTVAIAVQ
jgi:hypothetical protein